MNVVSIILTTYNSEKYLQKVIDSIDNQEGRDELFSIELIVVDDKSTDKTTEILAENNIPFISTGANSGGPNKGRNIGLKKVSGEYICIMDHDDEWYPDKLISQLPYLNKVPIVTSGYSIIYHENHKIIDRVNIEKSNNSFILYDKNFTFLSKLGKSKTGQYTYMGSIIYKSELKDILFEEEFGMLDFDWLLKLFYNQVSVEVCKTLYRRNVHCSNLSLYEPYRINDFYFSLKTINKYSSKYPEIVQRGIKRIHGSMARYYYFIEDMEKARSYFRKSALNLKNILYYITTFVGYRYIKNKFQVFG